MPRHKFKDEDLIALAYQELTTADTQGTNAIREQRIRSYQTYVNQINQDLYSSSHLTQVFFNEMFDYTERLTAYISKAVISDSESVVIDAVNPHKAELATQTRKILHHIAFKQNPGVMHTRTWIKDALISKSGIVKTFWDSTRTFYEDEVTLGPGGDIEAYIYEQQRMLGEDVEIQIVGKPDSESEEITETLMDEMGDTFEFTTEVQVQMTYTLRYWYEKGIVWEPIPREEFVAQTELVSLTDELTRHLGHRREMMIGDVVEMYPKVFKKIRREEGGSLEDAATSRATEGDTTNNYDYDYERINRFQFDGSYDVTDSEESTDPMSRRIQITESYHKIDYFGDGRLVWLKLVWAGSTVFEKTVVPMHPFSAFVPFDIPHKFDGQSLYDVLLPYIRSMAALLRSKVENSVFRNIVRLVGNARNIDNRQAQTMKSGVINAKRADASDIRPVETPLGSPDTIPILEYFDRKISAKIGISSVNDGTNVDLLKSGNSEQKLAQAQSQANTNVEMYVRNYAEGMKNVYWIIYNLMMEHKDKYSVRDVASHLFAKQMSNPQTGQMQMVQGQYIGFTMEEWVRKTDFSVKVGIGNMSRREKLESLMIAREAQNVMKEAGLPVPPIKTLNVAMDMVKASGRDNVYDYLQTEEELAASFQQMQANEMETKQKMAIADQLTVAEKQAEIEKTQSETQENLAQAGKHTMETQLLPIKTEAELQLEDPYRTNN